MRWLTIAILAGALLGNGSAALANKVRCKDIKAAIAAGKTPEQVATELGAKPKRVEACTSGKKEKKAAGAEKAPDAGQAPGKAAADDDEDED